MMKTMFICIVATLLLIVQFGRADVPEPSEDELIWETAKIPYLHDILVAPQGDLLYNISGKNLQIRRISDGVKIDSVVFDSIPNYLYHMSISADGRYIAFIGDNPFVLIYDLVERKEVKRIRTEVYRRKELFDTLVVYNSENWISASISPDGKRITGVATASDGVMTNFVVIDIETEKVLFEERRIYYDPYHPSANAFEWTSAKYSPDGKYIVAQLNFFSDYNPDPPDTVYIYDAKTLQVYDKVLNIYDKAYPLLAFSSYLPLLSYGNTHVYIYNFQNKTQYNTNIYQDCYTFLFSRNSKKIVYAREQNNQVYDIDTKEIIYKYKTLARAEDISLDNTKLLTTLNRTIYCLKTFWSKTPVEETEINTTLSPNPSTGILNISIQNNIPAFFRYDISSAIGQTVLSGGIGFLQSNSSSIRIDISSIPIGHYLLRISSDKEQFTFNIIRH